MKIIAISGSLRKESYNTKVLKTIQNRLGNDVEFEFLEIANLPFFNEDLEVEQSDLIDNLKNKLGAADVILIATPEYNRSISSVLKNAIDWASRGENNSFYNKKVGLLSTSLSPFGGVRGYDHLKKILLFLGAKVINNPEINIPSSYAKFSGEDLVDEDTNKFLNQFIDKITK